MKEIMPENKRSIQKKSISFISAILIGGILLTGCSGNTSPTTNKQADTKNAITFEDIHGIGYSSDGKRIFVPSHTGFIIYENSQWSKANTAANDYMGYVAVDKGFYSSGHPNPSSGNVNPLGIVKGTENGESLQKLNFEGEIDFHLMGVGYKSHAIYVNNEAKNAKLPLGFYKSIDDAKTWSKISVKGLEGEAISIAVHPERENIVAIGTDKGLFLSEDSGENFQLISPTLQVTSATFSLDGTKLFAGEWDKGASLVQIDLKTGKAENISIPSLGQDAVSYLSLNPVNDKEVVFTTFNKNVYISGDSLKTWEQIVKDGIAS